MHDQNYVSGVSPEEFEEGPLTTYKKTYNFVNFRKDSVSAIDSFQQSLGRTVLIAQFFGFMPVLGVTGTDASKLR